MKQLLIERISNIEVPKQTLVESINKNEGRLIIKNVLLQRADKPNRNKRVYPKGILDRALNEYFEKIKEKRAYSELDHPFCFWDRTEICTKEGWKLIKDVTYDDIFMTMNTATKQIEWQKPTHITNQSYRGKMIRFVGKNIDTCVTPNHRFYLCDQNGRLVVKTAEQILNNIDKFAKYYIPITAGWEGTHYDNFVIPANLNYNGSKSLKNIQSNDLILDGKNFFAFLGFYLAEGCVKNDSNDVEISQNEGNRAEQFRTVLSNLSPEITWTEYKHNKNITFRICDSRLKNYLAPLGNKYTKFIPDEIKDASSELLTILLDWFNKGDGSNVTYRGYNRKTVFTVSNKLINDLHEVLVKTGKSGVIKIQNNHLKDRLIEGRLIKGENSKPLNRLWIKKAKGIYLDNRFISVEEIDFDSTVHCVTVPNGTIYCRDERKPFWSGNSDLANVISLKNVCQVIKDARWVNDEIRGDIEVLNTPSGNIVKEILLAGYRVGQSSRGLGSVEPLHENDGDDELVEVQDDFEFLTLADCVSDPSTHNADMILGENKIYIPEAKISKKEELIREIICEIAGTCCLK